LYSSLSIVAVGVPLRWLAGRLLEEGMVVGGGCGCVIGW
jgi:hypothetical protein